MKEGKKKKKKKKRWNVIFIYVESLSLHQHIQMCFNAKESGKTRRKTHTHRTLARDETWNEHENERETNDFKSISHFPPHSINVYGCVCCYFYVSCFFLLFRFISSVCCVYSREKAAKASNNRKKIKHTKNNKRNISRAFC
jgi:hypothetical protein